MEKADLYTRITNRIIAELEAGTRPWLKPWNAEHAAGRITRPLRHNGIAAADFSRIRRANLGRFTIDRLMTILSRLGQEVEVSVNVHPRLIHSAEPETAPALR